MMHTHLVTLLIGYLILCLGYALFSMKTTRSNLFRAISLLYLGASVGTALFLYNQLLSLPKPVSQEFFNNAKEVVVLGSRTKDERNREIYLWLQLPGESHPRYYVMPWEGRAAEELEMAQREAREHGGQVMMNAPFQHNKMYGMRADEEERVFFPAFAARPPLKDGETDTESAAQRFEHTH
ncbi:MAG: hypothetical protein WCY26_05900 [Thiohalobacteraceae bacterium]|nr:hypothetical protein [Gammaproteobacteria bacterium]